MSQGVVRVLMVAEQRGDAVVVREMLRQVDPDGYVVDWLPSHAGLHEELAERRHQVCLLDRRVGDHDGLDVLTEARRRGCAVPFVLLAGRHDRVLEARARAVGAADFLARNDIDPVLLERAIRHVIERARAQEAIDDRGAALRAVFHASRDAMFLIDDHGRCIDANPAAAALFAVPLETLLDTPSLLPDEVLAAIAHKAAGTDLGRLGIRRANGERRVVDATVTGSILPGRHLAVLRDVTDRHRAEQIRARLASVIEATHDGVDGRTPDGRIDWWTPSAERMFGYSAHEIVGEPVAVLYAPDRTPVLRRLEGRLRAGDVIRDVETVMCRKDGSQFDASVTLVPSMRDGVLVGVSAVTRDISERKHLQAQLAVADRMASVGTLAAGVAHEINNPLAAMVVNLEVLTEALSELPPDVLAPLASPLADLTSASERIRAIVKDLKVFSRTPDQARTAVDIPRLIDSSVRMAWNEIRHRAQLVTQIDEVPPALGHEGRLGQVFLNLLVNAAQAIPEGNAGVHRITVRCRHRQGRVEVEVADTGVGIAPAVLPHVFDPFVTTKPAGIGTGLGLSICHRIVHDHGGEIRVDSAVGRGTTVGVSLPAAPPGVARAVVATAPMPIPSRRGRVLIVDDEEVVARAVHRLLAREHEVTALTDARAALARLVAGERWDVVICDLMMPDLTGMDLYERLEHAAPDAAPSFVFATGGAFTERAAAFLARVSNPWLDKPFDPHGLRTLVADRVGATHRAAARA